MASVPRAPRTLSSVFPLLAAEWHPSKNGDLAATDVSSGSSKEVWWRCRKRPTHEWQAKVYSRARGNGCPICAGRVGSAATSLRATNPELAAEWHEEKNGDLSPDSVVPGSTKMAWWRCSKDSSHQWRAKVHCRSRSGSGCPVCASLAIRCATIAAEWHETKNGDLRPDGVVPGSNKKVWWRCQADPTHEWDAVIASRVRGNGCPKCAGRVATPTTSLRSVHPELAAEWHPDRNGALTPDDVTPGSGKRVWWRCPSDSSHDWHAVIGSRTQGTGCPACSGLVATPATSLRAMKPSIAAEWHPTMNGDFSADDVVPGSEKLAWWSCQADSTHEWQAEVVSRTRGGGCPVCKSLSVVRPDLASQWHPTRNGDLTPKDVTPGTMKKAWWQCDAETPHEWEAAISNRASGNGCPTCSGRIATPTTSLTALRPDLATEWHPIKNGDLTPDQVVPGSARKVWWRCGSDPSHEWEGVVLRRSNGVGCPTCGGRVATPTTSLRALAPEIAAEWHPDRNGTLTPDNVVPGSARKAWWRCQVDPSHEWESCLYSRTRNGSGCPACNMGWTVGAIRGFVASVSGHLADLTPAELYLLFQQNGLLGSYGKGKSFVKALATGRFPAQEVEKFVHGEPSLVDDFLATPLRTLADSDAISEELAGDLRSTVDGDVLTVVGTPDDRVGKAEGPVEAMPLVDAGRSLAALEHAAISSADAEAVEFLIASAVAKIWNHAFRDEASAVAQSQAFSGGEYAERAKATFLGEYEQAKDLPIPQGYDFSPEGTLAPPNLMQRLVAVRLRDGRRVGNWSGTGAGKTLSAVLASRVVASRLTVVCCPNSVVEGWADVIRDVFPDSEVATKTMEPDWPDRALTTPSAHRYLILNYEAFQQPGADVRTAALVGRHPIDLVIIDEIHHAKQRAAEDMSLRRQHVALLVASATRGNPGLRVMGMSATPVVNNLQEGRSLVELITGVAHEDLGTRPTVPNCMRLHQRLATLGIRWMPAYATGFEQVEVPIDCSASIAEIRRLGRRNGNPLALEQILTRARLPVIREQIRPKTLIYTHYVQGIDRILREAIEADGWRVGFYTGDDKLGLDGFLDGEIDVLIGSGAIATGVDGLQQVCNRLIVAVLPWTAAEFEQLKGRIFRQGQCAPVTMIVPVTHAMINGEKWSWCESKLQRLRHKKSIADAAVDGVVPEGHLRTAAQAYQDLMGWLDRLDGGVVEPIIRREIVIPTAREVEVKNTRRGRRYGDFSRMNRSWNAGRSEATHERLRSNPEEWATYHALFREARRDWAVVPCEEMIRWCRLREGYVIGDFGCGEAGLAAAISDRHTVHSFDHVASHEDVVVCDLARVPLEDGTLDLAVFSLSLMGSNFADYLIDAHRTLKLDGELHIFEATSRFSDRDRFVGELRPLGFDILGVEDRWKFTHIRAVKNDRRPCKDVRPQF